MHVGGPSLRPKLGSCWQIEESQIAATKAGNKAAQRAGARGEGGEIRHERSNLAMGTVTGLTNKQKH